MGVGSGERSALLFKNNPSAVVEGGCGHPARRSAHSSSEGVVGVADNVRSGGYRDKLVVVIVPEGRCNSVDRLRNPVPVGVVSVADRDTVSLRNSGAHLVRVVCVCERT